MTFETNDNYSIWFQISNNSLTIQFEMKKHYSHSTSHDSCVLYVVWCMFLLQAKKSQTVETNLKNITLAKFDLDFEVSTAPAIT